MAGRQCVFAGSAGARHGSHQKGARGCCGEAQGVVGLEQVGRACLPCAGVTPAGARLTLALRLGVTPGGRPRVGPTCRPKGSCCLKMVRVLTRGRVRQSAGGEGGRSARPAAVGGILTGPRLLPGQNSVCRQCPWRKNREESISRHREQE